MKTKEYKYGLYHYAFGQMEKAYQQAEANARDKTYCPDCDMFLSKQSGDVEQRTAAGDPVDEICVYVCTHCQSIVQEYPNLPKEELPF